jgi:integrase
MTLKHNPRNERIKRDYMEYLRHAKRYSDPTIDGVLKSIRRFEDYTGFKDFKQFTRRHAMDFNRDFQVMPNARGTGMLSRPTVYTTLSQLRAFFIWLAGQPGYKSRLTYGDAEYFNLTDKQARIAKAPRLQRQPTLEQIAAVVVAINPTTDLDRRDQALIAFAILTGARDGALCSIKLRHVDLEQKLLYQDAREVNTKNSKTIPTFFFPIDEVFKKIVFEWVIFLQKEKLWGMDDPLFPATKIAIGSNGGFTSAGLDRKHWATASPIRDIFKRRFAAVGLPYYNPHSFRRTLALLGEKTCKTPEDFKGWSQNLGHDHVATTFTSYGNISMARQGEIMQQLAVGQSIGTY